MESTETTAQVVQTKVSPAVQTVDTSKLAQKDAVFQFIVEALTSLGKATQDLKAMADEEKKQFRKVVRKRLFESIKSGETKLSKQYDDSRLKKYCSGLINNWLKKDTRFN